MRRSGGRNWLGGRLHSVGIGDQLIATGLAKGAAARGKIIAFGDGKRILWDANSPTIFKGNPNIAPPKSTFLNASLDLEWIHFYKGNRQYNRHMPGRWEWNYDWRCKPGEIFLTKEEKQFAKLVGDAPLVIIEPNPSPKSPVANKQWPFPRFEEVARKLRSEGFDVVQLHYRGAKLLRNARSFPSPSFRNALAVLARAKLYIGGEGGMHHGAAAVGVEGRCPVRWLHSSRGHRLRPAHQPDGRRGGLWLAAALRTLCGRDGGDRSG